jgi:sirohydrochlorin ferrochelatase
MPMKALLITAHGSRKSQSNEEVRRLALEIETMDRDFDIVSHAFIEFTPPFFSDQVAVLVARGATRITVFPYFIAAGTHVTSDIPELIRKAENDHPGVVFILSPHLGGFAGIKRLILDELAATAYKD